MNDSAFIGQPATASTDGTNLTDHNNRTVEEKPIDLHFDPAIVQVGMSSSFANNYGMTDMADVGDMGDISNIANIAHSKQPPEDLNDPKLDVISDIATSSSPDQQDSDNGVIIDESGSGEMSSTDSTELLDSQEHRIEQANALLLQREANPSLPDTVTVLDGPYNSKVYLVGTAHFSEQSQLDVQETIRKTQPNAVILELCHSRLNILSLDEATVLEECKSMDLQKIKQSIREHGMVQGIMYLLLLNLSAHLTRELGMAPGGEFRRAFHEARKIPGCVVMLGDRPVGITIQRAISSLSVWQKLRLGFSILFSKETISKEEVEKCKQKDLLNEMMAEITGEFPALTEVFVGERDKYLAYSLYVAAQPISDVQTAEGKEPQTVVGVVGIGHVAGIVKNWGKVEDDDIPPLCELKKQSLTTKIIMKSIKYSVSGLLILGVYRYILPSPIKGICSDLVERAWSNVQKSINK